MLLGHISSDQSATFGGFLWSIIVIVFYLYSMGKGFLELRIRDVDPGSRSQKITGSRIPDPDMQHWYKYWIWILFRQFNTVLFKSIPYNSTSLGMFKLSHGQIRSRSSAIPVQWLMVNFSDTIWNSGKISFLLYHNVEFVHLSKKGYNRSCSRWPGHHQAIILEIKTFLKRSGGMILMPLFLHRIHAFWTDMGQCCGSESGSTGTRCFWASWIRIRIH
jgi:hypothetical protein